MRGTHFLLSAEGGTSQDAERNLANNELADCRARREGQVRTPKKPSDRGDSQTDECIGRDESGHQRKQNEQGALTCYRAQTEKQVRTKKETGRGALTLCHE